MSPYYYSNQTEPKGRINIKNGNLIDIAPTTAGKSYAFQISNSSGAESIVFAAFSTSHLNEWKKYFYSISFFTFPFFIALLLLLLLLLLFLNFFINLKLKYISIHRF